MCQVQARVQVNQGFLFHQGLLGQNTPVGIGLIELTKQSDKLNYKPFLKHCILQTILHAFLSFLFVWSKIFCSKNWALFFFFFIFFFFFDFVRGVAFDVTVLKFCVSGVLCMKLKNMRDSLATEDIISWE